MPQLDEGDLLLELRRLPGVALSESVAEDLRVQRALLALPEVEHAIGKTGAPELATDPMGIEQTDVYLSLRDREHWRFGKQQLAQEIERAVSAAVPEVGISVSQPIEMRTNELVAGIRWALRCCSTARIGASSRSSPSRRRRASPRCPARSTCGSSKSPAYATCA